MLDRLAALSQLLFLAFFLFTEWVDLHPWNNARMQSRRQHLMASLGNGLPILASAAGFWLGIGWLRWVGLAYWCVLLAAETLNWWIPYLFGVHLWEINPETYVKWGFDRTYRFLPRFRDHPVIVDGQHFVQILLTVVVVAAGGWAVAR